MRSTHSRNFKIKKTLIAYFTYTLLATVRIMKKIDEYSEKAGALFLIEQHTIGNLRDEADLDNAKYHAQQTIGFIEDLLLNIDGTIEEKIQFISKIKEELPKFHGKG
jgi:hypothetical protein